jgi:WD40 repeat protein
VLQALDHPTATKEVTSVAFGRTGEGRLLLISASVDKTVRWWDTTASKCVLTLRRRSGVRSIGVSGALLAIGDDEGISVIEPRFECFPLRPLR